MKSSSPVITQLYLLQVTQDWSFFSYCALIQDELGVNMPTLRLINDWK